MNPYSYDLYRYNPYGDEATNAWPMAINSSWCSGALMANAYVSMNIEASILQQQVNAYNLTNATADCSATVKKETWEDIYRALFPFDPIQEWAQKKIEEIDKKYDWLENKNKIRLRTSAPTPQTVTLKG